MTFFEARDLSVEYETEEGALRAVDGVDFELEEGETLGIVGESGCGKTTIAEAILGILPDNGRVSGGEIIFEDRNLAEFSQSDYRDIRWTEMSYIVQNAMSALDPVYRIGSQMVEVIRTHRDVSKREARERARMSLRNVDIDPGRMRDYPHELSGGQRQRVVIAMALLLEPTLVMADEPTTGLDVVVQDGILDLLDEVQSEIGNTMVFISHDISAVAEIADRVAVMYGGRIVEIGDVSEVFKRSAHPYTMGLNNAFPSLLGEEELVSIPGVPPDLVVPPDGCLFADRCPFATNTCANEPPLVPVDEGDDHLSKCHYADRAEEFREESRKRETWVPQ